MDKSNESLAKDLMYGWIKGWPNYIQNPKADYPAIIRIAEKCAKISGVSLDEEEGYMRIKNGLATIAAHCKSQIKWTTFNIFNIDIRLQDILLEMQAFSKAKEADKEKLRQAGKEYNEAIQKRKAAEKEMRDESKRILIEQIADWDIVWQYSYEVWEKTNKTIALKYNQAEKKLLEMSEENRNEVRKRYETRLNNWKEKLKNWED